MIFRLSIHHHVVVIENGKRPTIINNEKKSEKELTTNTGFDFLWSVDSLIRRSSVYMEHERAGGRTTQRHLGVEHVGRVVPV